MLDATASARVPLRIGHHDGGAFVGEAPALAAPMPEPPP
jgi:hypothetical protein